jgi:nuclear polyadenylated RNA-binding protein NAB2
VTEHRSTWFLGEGAGERRVLCKFPVCTNPSCQFRHEDAEGNPIPPPALTRAVKKNEDGNEVDMDAEHDEWDVKVGEGTASGLGNAKSESEVRMQLDNPLGDSKKPVATKPLNGTIATPCRFGSGCTNKFCKFTHPIDTPCRFGSRCFKGKLVGHTLSIQTRLTLSGTRRGLPILTSTGPQNCVRVPTVSSPKQVGVLQPDRAFIQAWTTH